MKKELKDLIGYRLGQARRFVKEMKA